jgi:hypothetical protein
MSAPTAEAVETELERILQSAAFHGSRRSSDFLRHVVTATLQGKSETLKERTLGVDLFARKADYDTGEDSIVRVKANDIRRRLSQAYQELGHAADFEIVLPAGAYVPEFRAVTAPAAPARIPLRTGYGRWLEIYAAVVTCLVVVLAWQFWHRPADGPYQRFWRPFLASEGQALVCVPHPSVFVLPRSVLESDSKLIERSAIVANAIDYVGVGDLMSASRLAAFFASEKKPYQIRLGNDTSFAEIRNSPAVFVGAFTNHWTMEMNQDVRFILRKEGGVNSIVDTTPPGRNWSFARTTDYALITRLSESRTGRPLMIAAGLGHFGTQAAGEFITSPAVMNAVLGTLAAGWERRNVQIVVRVEVLGKTPGPPRVVATHVW